MRHLLRFVTLLICVAPLAPAAGAAAAGAAAAVAADAVAPLKYTHVYADADGVSHFKEESFEFQAARPGGPLSHGLGSAPGAMLLRLKPGAVEDWHNAPRAWYLIVVQGMSEVTVGDGEKRRFGVGAIVLLDDTTGKGHQTRAVGRIDHIAVVVPIADRSAGEAK